MVEGGGDYYAPLSAGRPDGLRRPSFTAPSESELPVTVPFVCVVVAFVLIYLTKIPVGVAMAKMGRYDNEHPRDQQAKLTGWGQRALGSHQNSFEAFAPFAAAVMVAHLGGGSAHASAVLAVVFVVARVVYLLLYLANQSTLRSAVWSVGFFATLGLFLLPVL